MNAKSIGKKKFKQNKRAWMCQGSMHAQKAKKCSPKIFMVGHTKDQQYNCCIQVLYLTTVIKLWYYITSCYYFFQIASTAIESPLNARTVKAQTTQQDVARHHHLAERAQKSIRQRNARPAV